MMKHQSAISREIFTPRDEKLLVVIEAKKRRKKRLTFITTGHKTDYITFLCLSVTNKKPNKVFITKVKRYKLAPGFERRSCWSLDELRRVDGIDCDKDSPQFDLVFDRGYDQWVAGSTAEKCIFIQILYHLCKNYWASQTEPSVVVPPAGHSTTVPTTSEQKATLEKKKKRPVLRPTEFINCQSKLMEDACSVNILIYRCKIFLNRMKNSVINTREQQNTSSNQGASTAKAGASGTSSPEARIMGSVGRRASKVLIERAEMKHFTELSKSLTRDSTAVSSVNGVMLYLWTVVWGLATICVKIST